MFSRRTQAAIARVLAGKSHAYLDTLAYELEVELPPLANLQAKGLAIVQGVAEGPAHVDSDRIFLDLVGRLVNEPATLLLLDGGAIPAMLAAIELEGYEIADGRIVARLPGPVAAAEPLSWLDAHLRDVGERTAATHLKQAADNYSAGNWEACNGQARSFVEELLGRSGEVRAGRRFDDPTAAVQHLAQTNALDAREAALARALWNSLQERGPHAGLSDRDEALFRLHSAAAFGRYLVMRGLLRGT